MVLAKSSLFGRLGGEEATLVDARETHHVLASRIVDFDFQWYVKTTLQLLDIDVKLRILHSLQRLMLSDTNRSRID